MSSELLEAPSLIVMYGTPWCGDCHRARRFFDANAVEYSYIDITDQPEAIALVERLNRGRQTVPTILFPDGAVLSEPSNRALAAKLGLRG